MSTPAPAPRTPGQQLPAENTTTAGAGPAGPPPARVGTVVWGLIVLALAVLIAVSQLGLIALNGTYVLIGLMIGAGAALVVGGLAAARKRDNELTTRKS